MTQEQTGGEERIGQDAAASMEHRELSRIVLRSSYSIDTRFCSLFLLGRFVDARRLEGSVTMEEERTLHPGTSLSRAFLTPKVSTSSTSGPPPPLRPRNGPATNRSCSPRLHETLPDLGLPRFPGNDATTHKHQLPRVPPRPSPCNSLCSLFLEKNFDDFPGAHSQVAPSSTICPLDDRACLPGRDVLRNDENSKPVGDKKRTNSQELDIAAGTNLKRFRLHITAHESTRRAVSNCYFLPVSPAP